MRVQFVLNPFDGSETFEAAPSPLQSIDLANESSDEWLSRRSRQYRNCTTVTRVLHEGTELPKDKPIQWFVNYLIAGEAFRQTAATSVMRSRRPLTGWDPSAAALTLHIECRSNGDGTEASVLGCAPECKPCSPGSACSEPLSPVARHYANLYFDTYWKRAPDGAPCRYTDADCWHPGVQAAVVSTMAQIEAQGAFIEAAPILAFVQDKAVRQYGEIKNGHKFKRPPSRRCIARYRAVADMWLQRYSHHDMDGTIPEEVHGIFASADAHQLCWKPDPGMCCSPRVHIGHVHAAVNPLAQEQGSSLNAFWEEGLQTTLDFSSLSEETELPPSAQASSELDDGWLSSMVTELFAPDNHPPIENDTAPPDQDSVFQYNSPFSRQHSQSNKRKRTSATP